MSARRLMVGCEFTYEAVVPTLTILQVRPSDSPLFTRRSEAWLSTPRLSLRSYRDLYRNPCTRVVLPAGWSTVRYDAQIDVLDQTEEFDESAQEVPASLLPDETLLYTLPRTCC